MKIEIKHKDTNDVLYASLKADNSLTYQKNCVDYIAQIDEYLHKTIRHWAQDEINRSTRKGLEK